ncbi:MAG: M20 family metallopeptidase [Halobacteriaceae archaeon]
MDADSDLLSLARDLVELPSHEDATACGDHIASWLRAETDATVARDDAGNVVARAGSGPSLAFVGHHDVVPPDDEAQFDPAVREGRLYGRGSADMKGALAAAMCAFRDALAGEFDGELVFASFVGEEMGGEGARHAIESGFAPDYAVVGEGSTGYSAPGVTDVAIAHKGRRGSVLVAEGESAHASEVDEGVNAIYRVCDAVDVVRDLDAPTAEVLGHRLRGSLAVTEIEGGEAWNVVPDRCAVTVDERTVPGERAALDSAAIEGVTWTVEQDLPPMRCGDADFADFVTDAAADAQDDAPAQVVKPHATDAGWLSDAGTTCVVCGPAEPGEAHTADESVGLDVLRRCQRIYRTAYEEWPHRALAV